MAMEFSMSFESGPFPLMHPEQYATEKAKNFPNEGGPAILAVEIPDHLVELAIDDWFTLEQGVLVFDESHGIRQLMASWDGLAKVVRIIKAKSHE